MDLHLTQALSREFVSLAAQVSAAALVAGLWQGLFLCAATGVLLQALPTSPAKLRFVIWSAVFCVSVAMPFVNLAASLPGGHQAASPGPRWMIDPRWSYVVAGFWLAAVVYRAGELLLQGLGLRILWRSAVTVPDEALSGLNRTLGAAGRVAEICTSSEVDRPSVIGFFAPKILIPNWLFPRLTATELNHIVLHEMEHLRRRDDWMNLLQKIGLVLLPLNPALFWIDRRLSTERELACDDGVLERTESPRAYAASLTSVAERRLEARHHSRIGALALAATGMRRGSELGQRIESILGRRAPANRAFSGAVATVLVAGVVGSAAWLAQVPQVVSFGVGDTAYLAAPLSSSLTVREASLRPVSTVAQGPMAASARLEDVSFRQPAKTAPPRAKALPRTTARFAAAPQISSRIALAPAAQTRQFVVLTSWEDPSASSSIPRIVLATPDGRFLLSPYAAVPTQAGWLIVQL